MRELSTHEPECSTGGMPTVSQISRRPGPAFSLISGCNSPCLPLAMAMQPVWTTRMSFEISSVTRSQLAASQANFGELHPTTPTTPRMRPFMMLSLSGRYEARNRPPSM